MNNFGGSLLDWLREGSVLSKSVLFIWGLVLSYALVKKAVLDVLIYFLTDAEDLSLWAAIMLVNLLDVISAVFNVGLTHISEAYTGRFTVIIFCAAAYAMGLMLLWLSTSLTKLIFALVLIALGKAGAEPTLRDFFYYQLSEKVKKKYAESSRSGKENKNRSTNLWRFTASFIGSAMAVLWLGKTSWTTTFNVLFIIMGATYLLFFFGTFCYYPEERPSGSAPLTTIYRVFKAAIKKRRLPYPPSSEGRYYSNTNNIESLNDSEGPFCRRENDEPHLLPRVPACLLFLDKAAIIVKNSDAEREYRDGELCTVEQVRDVKSLYPIIPRGLMLFAYSLVSASQNTFFVWQASNLDSYIGGFHVPVTFLFVLKSFVAHTVKTIQSITELVEPIRSMAVGMCCSVLCGIAAWLVERRRLSLTIEDPQKEIISLTIMVLTPQYFLLGLMEGFAEDGLVNFLCEQVPESMRTFVEPCTELLLAAERGFSLLFAFVFGCLTNKSADTSLLDWYFLFLAILSFGFYSTYVCKILTLTPPVERQKLTWDQILEDLSEAVKDPAEIIENL